MLGKLNWDAIPTDQPIVMGTLAVVVLLGIVVLAAVTYFRLWGPLWKGWLTTVDPKRIGVMYIAVAILMLVRGFADALMMRTQLAIVGDGSAGFLTSHHYGQIFAAHGTIMIFFMAMPFMTGLFNVIVPLQIGARDVAFPFLNSVSFWLFVSGVILMMLSLFVGEFSTAGWLAYPPYSELSGSPGVGMDYYIWALELSGIGTTLSGVNFLVTILRMRAPGMTLMKMPVFTWTALVSNVLIVAIFPVLAATLALLGADRYLGTHFFTADGGGQAMMYVNLIWIWGHPEVYVLVLPAFGAYSEVISTFAGKPLFGYRSMVYATAVIGILAFIVWAHHFFTMGAGGDVNAFFGIATMVIAIPTGVKIFNWLFTIYRGRLRLTAPVYWVIGFIITFVIGGMTGVLMAIPAADFVLHNSEFLVAHFHNAILGGVVFGYLAALSFWFPKVFGFKLNERLGKCSFWCWFIGFYLAFIPIYFVGLKGMTRRLDHYNNPEWSPYLIVALIGALVILVGILLFVVQVLVSIITRNKNRDVTGDIWDARTLEWSIPSPAPLYNFAHIPNVEHLDQYWEDKEAGRAHKPPASYEDIHMPRNTGVGVFIGIFATILGFGLIWHIWWLAIFGFVASIASVIYRAYDRDTDYYIPAKEVEAIESAYYRQLPQQAA